MTTTQLQRGAEHVRDKLGGRSFEIAVVEDLQDDDWIAKTDPSGTGRITLNVCAFNKMALGFPGSGKMVSFFKLPDTEKGLLAVVVAWIVGREMYWLAKGTPHVYKRSMITEDSADAYISGYKNAQARAQ
jgi:hypothetical protein